MKSISTAIYILIAILVLVLAFTMTKPAIMTVAADGTEKQLNYIKLFNFKKA